MGLLAYQPAAVAALREAMEKAVAELRATVCWDVDAAAAMIPVRETRRRLEQEWLPLVRRVETSAALAAGELRAAGLTDLRNSLYAVLHDGYGWALQGDDRVPDTTLTPAEVRALGATLSADDIGHLVADPAEMAWMAEQLQIIARDPVLLREFLNNFDDWADLCNRLGYLRVDLTAGAPAPEVAGIDALFAGLAAVRAAELRVDERCVMAADVVPQGDAMTPYAAALLVRTMGLDSSTLATLALQLLEQWDTSTAEDDTYDRAFASGPNTADILLTAILADPLAAVSFVAGAAEQGLSVMFEGPTDPELGFAVALLGTDPAYADTAQAGESVLTIVRWFELSDGYPRLPPDWDLFLVDLISPYLFQFAPTNHDWPYPADLRADALAFVVASEAALQRLFENSQQVAAGLERILSDRGSVALGEAAQYLSLLDGLIRNEHAADAARERAMWEFWIDIANVAVSAAAGAAGGPVGGVGAGVALDLGGMAVGELISGWLPDPDAVRADEQHAHYYRFAVAAAAVALAVYAGWREAGVVGVRTPPPPAPDADSATPVTDFHDAFVRWLDELPGGADGALADDVSAVVLQFVNAEMVGQEIAG